MSFHTFDKMVAVPVDKMDILENYTFCIQNFQQYHKTDFFKKNIKEYNQFTALNVAGDYYDSSVLKVLFKTMGGKLTYIRKPGFDEKRNPIIKRIVNEVTYPEGATDAEKACLFKVAVDCNQDVLLSVNDVKVIAHFLTRDPETIDKMTDKRVQSFCKFIVRAAQEGAFVVGWGKRY